MSKKIIYWTGVYLPTQEGVSKELAILHHHFTNSFVYGISSKHFFRWSFVNRYLIHYYRPYRVGMKIVSILQKKFDINHVYHNLNNLYYINNLKKRPLVLTGAAGGELLEVEKYKYINMIVVESEFDRKRLIREGIEEEKVCVVYPGLDLEEFSYKEPKADFTILFASSPFAKEYFSGRGVYLLLSAAERCRDVQFILKWRRWVGNLRLIENFVQDKVNVLIDDRIVPNINSLLNEAHAVIAPFTTYLMNKPCPHSIIESLAAGKPVLVSTKVGITDIIRKGKCGVVFEPKTDALIEAIKELKNNYSRYQRNARICAEKYFSKDKFIKNYERIYSKIMKD